MADADWVPGVLAAPPSASRHAPFARRNLTSPATSPSPPRETPRPTSQAMEDQFGSSNAGAPAGSLRGVTNVACAPDDVDEGMSSLDPHVSYRSVPGTELEKKRRSDASLCPTPKPVLNLGDSQLGPYSTSYTAYDTTTTTPGEPLLANPLQPDLANNERNGEGSKDGTTGVGMFHFQRLREKFSNGAVYPSVDQVASHRQPTAFEKQPQHQTSRNVLKSVNSPERETCLAPTCLVPPQYKSATNDLLVGAQSQLIMSAPLRDVSNGKSFSSAQHAHSLRDIRGEPQNAPRNFRPTIYCEKNDYTQGADPAAECRTQQSVGHNAAAAWMPMASYSMSRRRELPQPKCWVSISGISSSQWPEVKSVLEAFIGPIDSWILTDGHAHFIRFRTSAMAQKCVVISGCVVADKVIQVSWPMPSSLRSDGVSIIDSFGDVPRRIAPSAAAFIFDVSEGTRRSTPTSTFPDPVDVHSDIGKPPFPKFKGYSSRQYSAIRLIQQILYPNRWLRSFLWT